MWNALPAAIIAHIKIYTLNIQVKQPFLMSTTTQQFCCCPAHTTVKTIDQQSGNSFKYNSYNRASWHSRVPYWVAQPNCSNTGRVQIHPLQSGTSKTRAAHSCRSWHAFFFLSSKSGHGASNFGSRASWTSPRLQLRQHIQAQTVFTTAQSLLSANPWAGERGK